MDVNLYNNLKNIFNTRFKNNLSKKTVMFPLKGAGFNYSRLDHTKDVKNIALLIFDHFSIQLKTAAIDEKDVEIAALYHDVGHCPFGHAGEETLNKLLSQDENNNFKYSFYSGYKHNLLSAIILLKECKENVPVNIIDAVLKHSSTRPKNFVAHIAKTHNIFTLNYIFRLDHEDQNNFFHKEWHNFIQKYNIKKECNNCKKYKNSKKISLISCSFDSFESRFNHYLYMPRNNKCNKSNYNITNYLLYPYPNHVLGYIIKFADEISCFANDLYYFGKYISRNKKSDNIIKKQINDIIEDIINYVEASYTAKQLAQLVQSILLENIGKDDRLHLKANIIDLLINNLTLESGNRCKYIEQKENKKYISINFDKYIDDIFWIIKIKIYSVIHKLDIIQNANENGSQALKEIFELYLNNFGEFMSISDDNKKEFKDYILKITGLNKRIKDNLFNCKTISEIMKELKINKNCRPKIENAYRRQIIFYIAQLNEEDITKRLKK